MVFKLDNCKSSDYVANYKPFQLRATAYGVGGVRRGFSQPVLAMIDPGAKHTIFGKRVMRDVLEKVKDENGNEIKPQGKISSQGVYGDSVVLLWYIIPNLCLYGATPNDGIHLTNVAVIASNSDNMQCLIGRTILHQCILTLDPKNDTMKFDFDDDLKTDKQTFCNTPVFEEVSLFAEF
jgi:hypothetical protein